MKQVLRRGRAAELRVVAYLWCAGVVSACSAEEPECRTTADCRTGAICLDGRCQPVASEDGSLSDASLDAQVAADTALDVRDTGLPREDAHVDAWPDANRPMDASTADTAIEDGGPADTADPMDATIQDSGPTDDASTADSGPADFATHDAGPRWVDLPRPPDPVFPSTVGTVSVTIRVGDGAQHGTNDPTEVCLTASDCFVLNVAEVDDLEPSQTDVHHFEGLSLPRSSIDRVELATRSTDPNNDRLTPACLHIRLDGEPVYCETNLPHIGTNTGAGEFPRWRDPQGLHQNCGSCWDDAQLTHGPMVGAPATESARVWVRTDATRTVGVRVGRDMSMSDAVIRGWTQPTPADDFASVVDLTGLEPNTDYFYQVEIEGMPHSQVLPLRTVRQGNRFRFAMGSCSQLIDQPIFAPILDRSPELFFFVGDNHYGNAQNRDAHRFAYRRFRGVESRRALQARVPSIAIWDDHDFLANNSHQGCRGRHQALEGFREYWANPGYGTGSTPGVFFRHREGPAEIFALDCRMYRPDVGDPRSNCELQSSPPPSDPTTGPLGSAQTQWLNRALLESDAPFKLLACGSRFTREGSVDSWASYPAALAALESFLHTNRIEGVVFLSGDIHRTVFRTNPRSSGYAIPEITSSPLARGVDNTCADEPGQRYCLRQDSFVMIEAIGGADARLIVTAHNVSGDEQHRWRINRSELSYAP